MASPASSTEQRAAKRKSHRKSRNGCFQCKTRHTKCNEEHPRCGNCVRLDIECAWPARERFSANYPTPPETQASANPERTIHVPAFVAEVSNANAGTDLGIADLRLLHHWTAKTCEVMSERPQRCNAWRMKNTELALDHPFLLRGVLAVAAMHKVLLYPDADQNDLLSQAGAHIDKALTTYRLHLEQPRPEVAVPMFLLSALLVVYNLAAAHLEEASDPINVMTHCFRLIQGVVIVAKPNWEQVTASEAFKHLASSQQPPIGHHQSVEEILRLNKVIEMKNLAKTPAGDVYFKVIDDLHTAFVRTRNCGPDEDSSSVAFSWTSYMSDSFTQLLDAHDPIAVLILAHFAVLISEGWQSWWLNELPERIILATQKLLMSTPELLDFLDWPLQMLDKKRNT